jgi:hypothetical protein
MTVLTAADESGALEQLHGLGCTDGLPVVVPTPARVERLVLAAVADWDRSARRRPSRRSPSTP